MPPSQIQAVLTSPAHTSKKASWEGSGLTSCCSLAAYTLLPGAMLWLEKAKSSETGTCLYLFTMWNTLFDGLLMASPHSLLTESLYMVVTAPCQWPAPFTVMGSGVYV